MKSEKHDTCLDASLPAAKWVGIKKKHTSLASIYTLPKFNIAPEKLPSQ